MVFKIQVIKDNKMENHVCISFYLREAAIRIHRKTLDNINNPLFVRFLVSEDRKTFAVKSCAKKDLRSFRIRMNINSKTDKVEIYSSTLCASLAKINGWDENNSYRVYGKAFPNQGIAVFDFSETKAINNEVIGVE